MPILHTLEGHCNYPVAIDLLVFNPFQHFGLLFSILDRVEKSQSQGRGDFGLRGLGAIERANDRPVELI